MIKKIILGFSLLLNGLSSFAYVVNEQTESITVPEFNNGINNTVVNSLSKKVTDFTFFRVADFCAKNDWQHVVWVHIHENEQTALQAAKSIIQVQDQGCIYSLEHGKTRNVSVRQPAYSYQFDPNRMFSLAGIDANLNYYHQHNRLIQQEISAVASQFYLQFLANKSLIVTFHNNTKGGYGIHSYQNQGNLSVNATAVFVNNNMSPDDFFYVTQKKAYDFFKKHGFNVVLQNNQRVKDDGSLSVFAAKQGQDYINIEAEYGHLEVQQQMTNAVIDYMKQFY